MGFIELPDKMAKLFQDGEAGNGGTVPTSTCGYGTEVMLRI